MHYRLKLFPGQNRFRPCARHLLRTYGFDKTDSWIALLQPGDNPNEVYQVITREARLRYRFQEAPGSYPFISYGSG